MSFTTANENFKTSLAVTLSMTEVVAAGATQVVPVANEYGWRLGRIVDPFKHHWEIGKELV